MSVFITAIFLAITFSVSGQTAASELTADDIREALPATLEHPYILFNEAGKQEILDRIGNDRESNDIYRRLEAECKRLIYTPVEKTAPPQDPRAGYTGNDQRLAYLRSNISNAMKLAFLYQMTDDTRYAEKSFEFADIVCDLPGWVDRRHQFPVIYSRVWPWNVPDDQSAFAVDLEAADSARKLAIVYDWLYSALDRRQRDRIRGAILEKAILPVRGNYDYFWWTSSYRCNWCACCNSALGTAALSLLTEDPVLVDVVAEAVNRITKTFDQIGIDGGWQEGCGYYRKGIHGVNFFADPLNRLTKRRFNLYDHPRIKANPVSFLLYNTVTPRRLLPMEDSKYNRAGTSHIWNKLAEETGSAETAWFRNYMWGDGSDMFDIIWPRPSIKPRLPKKTSVHFRGIDWAVLRTDFANPETAVIACKAGMNDDPHHGHLDCGHFIFYWRNQEYISDSSSPDYDELFFDEARYDYVEAASLGHNVVMVNGEQQMIAKLKDQPWKEGVGGKILEFRPGREQDYVLIDPSGAYPGKELKSWRRHIIYVKPRIAVVLDEIGCDPGADIEVRFHSHCTVTPHKNHVTLVGDEGRMALLTLSDTAFDITKGKDPSLVVLRDAKFKWVPWFATSLKAEKPVSYVATLIMPMQNDSSEQALIESADMTVNNESITVEFTAGNHPYRFSFTRQNGEYRLK